MSTRAVVKIYDEEGKALCTVYKHWDGYPEGMLPLLDEFAKKIIVNGIPGDLENASYIANGMGCLAAQIIEALKQKVGDVYIVHNDADVWQEYEYIFKFDGYDKPPKFEVKKV